MTASTATVAGAELDAYWTAVAAGDARAAYAVAAATHDRGVPLPEVLDRPRHRRATAGRRALGRQRLDGRA